MSDQDTYSFTAHIVVMRNGLTKEDAATEVLEFMLDHDIACSLHEEADEIERLKRDYAEAQHKIGEYVDATARLTTEIKRLQREIERLKKELALRTPKGLQHD